MVAHGCFTGSGLTWAVSDAGLAGSTRCPRTCAWSGPVSHATLVYRSSRSPLSSAWGWGGGGGWTGSLVDMVDAGPDARVVVIGPGALDVGCALMQAGSLEVTFVTLGTEPRCCRREARADAAVVPRPGSLDAALRAVRVCGRTLVPFGTAALGRLEAGWIAPIRAELERIGFDDVRSWAAPDGFVIRAELPSAGPMFDGRGSCA